MSVILSINISGLTSTSDRILSILGQVVDKSHSITLTDGEYLNLKQDQYNGIADMVDAGYLIVTRSGGDITSAMIRNGSLGIINLEIPTVEIKGDIGSTLQYGVNESTIKYASNLTQNRAIILSVTDALDGAKFSIHRTGGNAPSIAEVTTISGITSQAGGLSGGEYFTLSSPTVNYYAWYQIGPLAEISTVTCGAASTLLGAEYFTLSSTTVDYYVWYSFAAQAEISRVECKAASTLPGVGEYFTLSSTTVDYYVWYSFAAVAEEATIGCLAASALGAGGQYFTLSSTTVDYYAWIYFAASGEFTTISGITDAAGLSSGDYFTIHSTTVDYYVWFNKDAGGGDPTVPGYTGIEVTITTGDSANDVAIATAAAIDAVGGAAVFNVPVPAADSITIENLVTGVVTHAADSTGLTATGFTFTVDIAGHGNTVDPTPGGTGIQITLLHTDTDDDVADKVAAALHAVGGAGVVFTAANPPAEVVTCANTIAGATLGGAHIADGAVATGFSFTTTQNGSDASVDPAIAGATGLPVVVLWTDTANQIATKTAAVLDAHAAFVCPAPAAAIIVITNAVPGLPNGGAHIADGTAATGFTFSTFQRGLDLSVDPTPGGTGIEVAILDADTANQVATKTAAAIHALGGAGVIFNVPAPAANAMTITNVVLGLPNGGAHIVDTGATGFTVGTSQNGANAVGADPAIGGATGIPVLIALGDSANAIAIKTAAAIDAVGGAAVFNVPVPAASSIVITNLVAGAVTHAADGTAPANTGFTFTVSTPGYTTGAWQLDIGGLKNLALSEWCEVVYSESLAAWYLSEFGAL